MNQNSIALDGIAKKYGGFRSFYFRQGDQLVVAGLDDGKERKVYKDFTTPKGEEMGGVCATVCAFWVVFHAKQESNFQGGVALWDYLFSGGKVDRVAAYAIATEHALTYGDQEKHLEAFLLSFGVKRRTKQMSGKAMSDRFLPLNSTPSDMVSHITSGGGGYKLLSLKPNLNGSGGGHQVATYWDGSDVVFMDPNFGEFWLPTKAAFESFLVEYLQTVYQQAGVQKYKAFRVMHYT